jgi:photosystem II stability/assembly factor-like uncharacterized protein
MPIDYRVLVAGVLAASTLAAAGCLPTPEIQVPDFSPAPTADAGTGTDLAPVDGASGDLGTMLRWSLDGQAVATDTLRAVWVADAALSQAYAVGHNGLLLRRNAGVWQKETVTGKPITSNLYAIAAASPDLVYAVGDAGVILRRAAGTWTQEGQELATTAGLFGVTVLTTGEVIVVGDGGLVARRQLSGIYVAEDTTGLAGANLRAVTGTALDGLYAVGMGAVVAQRVAGKWQLDPLPIDTADRGNYYAVSQSPDGVFLAGEYTRVLRRDVAKWIHEPTLVPMPPTVTHFFGLYAAPGELFAVGSGGVIQHRDAASQTWSNEPSGVSTSLYGIVGASAKAALTVGEQGILLRRM